MVKLSPEAVEKFGQLFREFKTAPTQKLKTEIVSIFAPLIESKAAKAAAKSGGRISAADYAQDLYLKFLERLETVGQDKKYIAKALTETVNETKPTANTLVTYGRRTVEELTPLEELNHFSVRPGEQTLLQKAEEIANLKHLTKRENEILKLSLEGYSFEEIAEKFDISSERTKQIRRKVVSDIKTMSNQPAIQAIYFDDLKLGRAVSVSSLGTLDFEKIREIELRRSMPIAEKVLNDDLMREYIGSQVPGWKQKASVFKLFGGSGSEFHIKNILRENPDFKIKIRLPEKFNAPDIIKGAELLSIETYGKNIFEFI